LGDSGSRLDVNDPIIVEIMQRLARVEARVDSVEKEISWIKEALRDLKERLESLDSRAWLILAGIVATLLVEILLRVIR
jgi:archaellum component FlaC